jgi:hypothetical protein
MLVGAPEKYSSLVSVLVSVGVFDWCFLVRDVARHDLGKPEMKQGLLRDAVLCSYRRMDYESPPLIVELRALGGS